METGLTSRSSPENLAVAKHRYDINVAGVTLSAEPWLAKVEAAAAPWINHLREAEDDSDLDIETFLALARLASAQFFRSPAFASWMETNKKKLAEKDKEVAGAVFPPEVFKDWEQQPDTTWLNQEPESDLATKEVLRFLEGAQGYANMLMFLMDWTLLRTEHDAKFYTSDAGLVRWPSPLDDGVLPGSFVSFDYYLPISSSRALRLRPRTRQRERPELPRLAFKKASRWDVCIANSVQSVSATRFLYGGGPWLTRNDARRNLDRQMPAAGLSRVIAVTPTPAVSEKAVHGVANARARALLAERAKETGH